MLPASAPVWVLANGLVSGSSRCCSFRGCPLAELQQSEPIVCLEVHGAALSFQLLERSCMQIDDVAIYGKAHEPPSRSKFCKFSLWSERLIKGGLCIDSSSPNPFVNKVIRGPQHPSLVPCGNRHCAAGFPIKHSGVLHL